MIYDNEFTVLDESNAMKIVNEAYFGKTKEVLTIEQAVHDLREPYVKDIDHNFNINTYTPKMNRDPNKQKLQEAICNAFGFSDALINIQSTSMPNFGTESTSYCIDLSSKKMRKSLKSTRNGFKYDRSSNIMFCMTANTGILCDSDLSDAEITAGILHEIGHNFSPAISRGVYAMSMFPAITWVSMMASETIKETLKGNPMQALADIPTYISGAIRQTNIGHHVRSEIDSIVTNIGAKINKKCPELIKLIGGISTASSILQSAVTAVLLAVKSLWFPSYLLLPFNALLHAVDTVADPSGYEDEKFADAFTTSYGYGQELNSFLIKLRDYNYSVGALDKNIPIFSALKEAYMLPFTVVLDGLDEHPVDAARASSTIKQLKKELDNDKSLKPATKKKIEEDIKNIEKLYDHHQESMRGLPKGSDVYRAYQQTMFKVFGGDIRGKFVATHVSDDIDKAYAATRESIDVWDNKERIGIIKENTDKAKTIFKELMDF